MARPIHPNKEVEQTLTHAEAQGWKVVVREAIAGAHLLPQ